MTEDRASRIHPYRTLIVAVSLVIAAAGFAFLVSATYNADKDTFKPSPVGHLRWVVLGVVVFVALQWLDYQRLERHALVIYGFFVGLLVLTALFGEVINNSKRWLPITGSLGIQPSEFMKIGLVLVLARALMHVEQGYSWRRLAVPCLLTGLPIAFVIRQPDLGMCLLYMPILGVMVWASGVQRRVLLALVIVFAVTAPPFYFFGLKDYQRARIETFVNWDEAKHAKFDLYQPRSARIAVASGGLLGKGLFKGPQNVGGYLPAKYSDYIFAVIAEEGGFVVCLLFLLAYYVLVSLLFHAAMEFREPFGRLVLVGVGGLIGTQVLVNAAVASGALPTTGLTLPLVSHGGSSFLTTCVLLGLTVSVLGRRVVNMARPRF